MAAFFLPVNPDTSFDQKSIDLIWTFGDAYSCKLLVKAGTLFSDNNAYGTRPILFTLNEHRKIRCVPHFWGTKSIYNYLSSNYKIDNFIVTKSGKNDELMNNIRIYAFFWMIVLLTVSCYEDKGNYDYHPINEVKISGIKEDPYEILRWDTLKIPVTLENSLNEKAKLIYAWYLDQKKIAETEDLCYVVSDKAKKYQARMEVTLPEDDSVRFFADFEVQVFSPYSKGLLLLSDYEDYPEVSFMSTLNNPTNKIMRDVYSLENKRELKGKALAIEQSDEYSYGGTVFVHTSASSH